MADDKNGDTTATQRPNGQNGETGATIGDRLGYVALRGLLDGVSLLPYKIRVPFMGWLVARVIGPIIGYRKRATSNLELVWPDMDAGDRRRLAIAACNNAGRMMIEQFSADEFARAVSGTAIEGPGLAVLQSRLAEGKGAILVGGHFGNYEVIRKLLMEQGTEVSSIYRAMSNTLINEWYAKSVYRGSGPTYEQGKRGTAGFIKTIARGNPVAILFDLNAPRGVPIPFMGHDAMTAPSAAELAIRFKVPMLPAFAVRQPDGLSFRAFIEEPVPLGTPEEMMRGATERLEARIRENPEQWFWIHRRWKTKR